MIKGEIVSLRGIEEDDLSHLKIWRNNPGFRKNFREHRELTSLDQKIWYEWLSKHKENNYMFSIIENNGKIIGACGLLYVNWISRYADFSFYIGDGNEYCEGPRSYDACKMLIDYGFKELNLNKVWMELYEFDEKKIKFFESSFNFKKDGILRENLYTEGKYYDSYIFSLLKKDY